MSQGGEFGTLKIKFPPFVSGEDGHRSIDSCTNRFLPKFGLFLSSFFLPFGTLIHPSVLMQGAVANDLRDFHMLFLKNKETAKHFIRFLYCSLSRFRDVV